MVGAHREFDVRFVEGIGKLARNTLGDHRRKTVRLAAGDSGGYRNVGGSDDVAGNSPEMHRKLAEGIESLLGWHKGVRQQKIETCRKIVEVAETFNHDKRRCYRSDMDPGSNLGIEPRIGRCGESSLGVRYEIS
ncbi:hypothetical protein BHE74_00050264 [Ensete ventricosum]|nr:hypothetical protein BHE74_00050264 [Ensete ventricosum]RZS21933.1 hypothetical protein BHM03_00054645 [Ensete ventricosum]